MGNLKKILAAVAAASAIMTTASASAQEAKHYRFAYDQPKTTGYGILGDIFSDKLKELSKGSMLIDQYPGAQLGQEPQVLQLVKAGDVEFCISSSANAATLSPQAGVMSMHFLFRSEGHLIKAIADSGVSNAVKAMSADTVQGARVIGATDKNGVEVAERPVTVPDLFCTFCRALEINPREENQSNVGRPLKIVETGRAVAEVFEA